MTLKFSPKQTTILQNLGYEENPLDFISYYPLRYEDIQVQAFSAWEKGKVYALSGKLASSFTHFRKGKLSITRFTVISQDQLIPCVIYNRPYIKAQYYQERISLVGTLNSDQKSILVRSISNKAIEELSGIKAIYPLKSGLKNHEIAKLMEKLLREHHYMDIIPDYYRLRYRLLHRHQALSFCHFPASQETLISALRTLKYEEFLRYHLAALLSRDDSYEDTHKTIDQAYYKDLLKHLPFELSGDQAQSMAEIIDDITNSKAMYRLLQGDVGSGKTIIAFLTIALVAHSGYQSVFLLPTEILMQQHLDNFKRLFPQIDALALSQSTANRDEVLTKISKQECSVIFGTHALFQKDVIYSNLGLVVIDEQHRFGVKQRQALIAKGNHPDLLMLSATPIPRTLASSLYFDLHISELRSTHKKARITTILLGQNSLISLLPSLKEKLAQKEQIYIVAGAIEEGERSHVRNVNDLYKHLSKEFMPYRCAMIHGGLKSDEKENVMQAFAHHEIDVLIATTVIEVGVDVHNANTMIIYNAENYGLATLHQLRGRIGRGVQDGTCYLLTDSKTPEVLARLEYLVGHDDGFDLAEYDMRMRGFGDVLGVRQSGIPHFILGDVFKDEAILSQAKKDALTLFEDPDKIENQAILELVKSQV